MADKPTMRRKPQRKRGQERVQRILDTAAILIAEHGYDSVTTNQIASEANTSIGSLYQFFPNKESILVALSERYLTDLRDTMHTGFEADESLGVFDQLDQLIDIFHDFYMAHPGFKPLMYGSYGLDTLSEATWGFYMEIIGQFSALFERRLHLSDERRHIAAMVMVSIVKTQVTMIDEADAALRPALLRELKAVIRAYVKSLTETEAQTTDG